LKTSRPETKRLLRFFPSDRRVLGDDPRVRQGREKQATNIYLVELGELLVNRGCIPPNIIYTVDKLTYFTYEFPRGRVVHPFFVPSIMNFVTYFYNLLTLLSTVVIEIFSYKVHNTRYKKRVNNSSSRELVREVR
jgi:hypothetical protein